MRCKPKRMKSFFSTNGMNTQTWTHQIVSLTLELFYYALQFHISLEFQEFLPSIIMHGQRPLNLCTCVYITYGCQKCIVGHHVCLCVCMRGMDVSVVKFIQFHSHSYSHSLAHKPVHTMVFICFIPWSMRNLKNPNPPPAPLSLPTNVERIPSLENIITIKFIYANARFSRIKRMDGQTTSCTRTQIHKCCTIPTINIGMAKAL